MTSLAQENGTLSDSDRFLLPSVRVLLFISVQVSSSRSVRDSFVQSRREVRGRERERERRRPEWRSSRPPYLYSRALIYLLYTLAAKWSVSNEALALEKNLFFSFPLSPSLLRFFHSPICCSGASQRYILLLLSAVDSCPHPFYYFFSFHLLLSLPSISIDGGGKKTKMIWKDFMIQNPPISLSSKSPIHPPLAIPKSKQVPFV